MLSWFCQIAATFTGAVTGPMFGLFIMGGISRHTNWKVCHTIQLDLYRQFERIKQ